jgi:hypothetical protein
LSAFQPALDLLAKAGIAAGTPEALRHGWFSEDRRYCAVTLDNLQSYIVDLAQRRYLHYPEASAAGFKGHVAIMSPDEVRFNMFSWDENTAVDLEARELVWIMSTQ